MNDTKVNDDTITNTNNKETKIYKKTNLHFICSDDCITIPSTLLVGSCLYISNILSSDEVSDKINIDVTYTRCDILIDAIALCGDTSYITRYAALIDYLKFFNHMLLDVKIMQNILDQFLNDSINIYDNEILEAYICFPDMFTENNQLVVQKIVNERIMELSNTIRKNGLPKKKMIGLIVYLESAKI